MPMRPTTTTGTSWVSAAWNTVVLRLHRRRGDVPDREPWVEDRLLGSRGWLGLVAAVVALVVLGAAAFVVLPRLGEDAATTDIDRSTRIGAEPGAGPGAEPGAGGQGSDRPTRSRAQPSSQADPDGTAARSAAGAELARRSDVYVTPEAAQVLRSGEVDGRVLLVLATLATDGRLNAITTPPDPDAVAADPGAVEFAAADVDGVLAWLDTQPSLAPDAVVVRRADRASYVRLVYDTPEPPQLFGSGPE